MDLKKDSLDKDGEKEADNGEIPSAKAGSDGNGVIYPSTAISSKEKPPDKDSTKKVGLFELFRFADGLDVFMMIVGSLCAIATGASFPTNVFFFGDMITHFVVTQQTTILNQSTIMRIVTSNDSRLQCYKDAVSKYAAKYASAAANGSYAAAYSTATWAATTLNTTTTATTTSTTEPDLTLFHEVVERYVPAFCGIAIGVLVCSYVAMALWVHTAERQVLRIRLAFFRSVLKQDVGWFDTHPAGELNTRLADDIDMLHEGLGDKVATFLQWTSTFVGGFIIGLVQGWKLALVIISITPVLVISATVLGRVLRTFVQKELKAYAKAGAVATEVLTAIRTVAAFGGQSKAIDKYGKNLITARKEGIFKNVLTGVMGGVIWFIIFAAFGLAYWYGAKLVRDDCMEPGIILQVFFGVLIGAMSLGQAAPLLQNFTNARGAAAVIFEIIDTPSKIDSSSEAGLKLSDVKCNIEYRNIHFRYPARTDVQVMKGLSLSIKTGQTVALVGPSGCGKSTLIQLLQRFYDPQEGAVFLDGTDIRELNVRWLRSNIGVVGQEPVLFDTTIEDNIKLGGTDVSTEDVVKAAKLANCYDFINKMPQKFQTLVGERGAQLSGGQKQRIAIARAVVGNPKILLLDEATSALDTASEALVQAALEKAGQGRTTIVVAHRLSTVRNADVIFALNKGEVVESGTHAELMEKKGLYYSLHAQQQAAADKEKQEMGNNADSPRDDDEPLSAGNETAPNGSILSNGIANGHKSPAASHKSPSLHRSPLRSSVKRRSTAEQNEFARLDPVRSSLRSLRDATPTLLSVRSFDAEEAEHGHDEDYPGSQAEGVPDVPLKRIFMMNKPEMAFIVIGCLASMLSGIVQPSFAIIMSEIFGVFGFSLDPDDQERKIAFWTGMMVLIGVGSALVTIIQSTMFAFSGERLTERLRVMSFSAMLRQEMGWFDEQRNQVGALTAQLATEASSIKGATGARAGVILQAGATIVAALVISFAYMWELTLVVMLFFPLTMAGGLIQGKLLHGFAVGDKAAVEQGGKIAQEVVGNIRTVIGLNKEHYFVEKFSNHFERLFARNKKKSFIYGIAYGSSQSIVFFAYAVCFSFGAYLVNTKGYAFFYVLRVFSAVTFGGMSAGRATAAAPDFAKAKVAASKLFQLLDRKSAINYTDESGMKLQGCRGEIQFSDVAFRYPTRPTVPILRNLSVQVAPGERLALVGASGSGKSTAVSLVERFYDPLAGKVSLDGIELRSINIQSLRCQLGIVSQEPILFDDTIALNIAYGDNTREASMQEIIDAARKANIHDFISTLPKGYDTTVGDKGTQLSGGQKQRIAIARAMLRNPQILLLDEATSALDTESEKVVQEALNKAQEGRTCIIIAHRLSTIKNSTKIGVIHNGVVAELGSHDELVAQKGLYYNLVNAQLS